MLPRVETCSIVSSLASSCRRVTLNSLGWVRSCRSGLGPVEQFPANRFELGARRAKRGEAVIEPSERLHARPGGGLRAVAELDGKDDGVG